MSSMVDEVHSSHGHNHNELSEYGSDDEEVERLLMDAVQEMEHQASTLPTSEPTQGNHDMDMTIG